MRAAPHSDPAPNAPRTNLLALDVDAMARLAHDLGWPRYRAMQVLRWLYRKRARSVEEMTDLPRAERHRLDALAEIGRSEPGEILTAADGTKKFLIPLADGLRIESVLIPDDDRLTLCLSTQVGCTLDCGFCLTARMGLMRNLKPHEIVEQVLTVQDHLPASSPLKNLVFMGMGEPLANLEAVSEAIRRLTNEDWGLGVPARRITVSTAGLAPRLAAIAPLGVNLAVSLNATTNTQRDRLMPAVNRLYPLETLLTACRAYPLPPRRTLTFEYVLLAGVNDSPEDARRLATLLRGMRCKINLIPFNEFADSGFQRPEDQTVLIFQSVLTKAGYGVFIRKSKGREILGACGQLGRLSTRAQPRGLTLSGTRC